MHRVPRDEEGEHLLHAGVLRCIVETRGQDAARTLCGDVAEHVGRKVSASVNMRHIERYPVRVGGIAASPVERMCRCSMPSTTWRGRSRPPMTALTSGLAS